MNHTNLYNHFTIRILIFIIILFGPSVIFITIGCITVNTRITTDYFKCPDGDYLIVLNSSNCSTEKINLLKQTLVSSKLISPILTSIAIVNNGFGKSMIEIFGVFLIIFPLCESVYEASNGIKYIEYDGVFLLSLNIISIILLFLVYLVTIIYAIVCRQSIFSYEQNNNEPLIDLKENIINIKKNSGLIIMEDESKWSFSIGDEDAANPKIISHLKDDTDKLYNNYIKICYIYITIILSSLVISVFWLVINTTHTFDLFNPLKNNDKYNKYQFGSFIIYFGFGILSKQFILINKSWRMLELGTTSELILSMYEFVISKLPFSIEDYYKFIKENMRSF